MTMGDEVLQWICSERCWEEGGPHDEFCRPYRRTAAAVVAENGDQ